MNRYLSLIAATLLSVTILSGSLCLTANPALAESCGRAPASNGADAAPDSPQQPLHRCPNFSRGTIFERQGILPSPFYGDETLAPHFVHSQFVTVCKGMARVHSVSFLPDANTPHYFVARGSCL